MRPPSAKRKTNVFCFLIVMAAQREMIPVVR
jgi:hypothetical protein